MVKPKYYFLYFELKRNVDTYEGKGDFIDIYDYPSGLDLSKLYVKVDDADFVSCDKLPIVFKQPFSKITVKNETGVSTGVVKFIIGGEAGFRLTRQMMVLTEDRTTIEANIQKLLNSIGDAGTSPTNTTGYTCLWWLNNIRDYVRNLGKHLSISSVYYYLTSTPLGAGAEYVESFVYLEYLYWSYVIATVYSDVDGTLYVEQSPDGTNVDRQDSLSYTGGSISGNMLKVQIMMRYVRVRYVNGATAQTVFRLGKRWSEA